MLTRLLRLVISLGIFFSAGCASLDPFLASLTPPTPVPTRTPRQTPTPPALPTSTVPVEPETSSLRVWLPAQFNLAAENRAAELLTQRLQEFESQYSDLKIEVRIKTAETDGEILNALSTTSAAAPLPSSIGSSAAGSETARWSSFSPGTRGRWWGSAATPSCRPCWRRWW